MTLLSSVEKETNLPVSKPPSGSGELLDWRIIGGLSLTGLWLLLGIGYISRTIGWSNVPNLPADQLGNFLEGAFAPLAFLWLVIGYFLQQRELQQNSAALREQAIEIQRTAEQAVIQSEKMARTERYAREQNFLTLAQTVRTQLGSISGLLFISSQAGEDGTVTEQEVDELFMIRASRDAEVFSRRLLTLSIASDEEASYELFYGSAIRARRTNHFIFIFERLLERAKTMETDEIIRDSLLASAHAFLYKRMKRQQANAPSAMNDHTKTGLHFDL